MSSTAIIDNVPDALATEIPRFFLVFSSTTVVMRLNRKTWRKQQVGANTFETTILITDLLSKKEEKKYKSILFFRRCSSLTRLPMECKIKRTSEIFNSNQCFVFFLQLICSF